MSFYEDTFNNFCGSCPNRVPGCPGAKRPGVKCCDCRDSIWRSMTKEIAYSERILRNLKIQLQDAKTDSEKIKFANLKEQHEFNIANYRNYIKVCADMDDETVQQCYDLTRQYLNRNDVPFQVRAVLQEYM